MPNFIEILSDKKIRFIFCLIILFLFSGCNISQKNKVKNNNWQNEVLLADECGYDGLKCCTDNPEQLCKYGQNCCFNPQDENDNYCATDCELGKEKSFCRLSAPSCDAGLVCQGDRCLACGKENQFCCEGSEACAANLFCHNSKCLTCGQGGHPCCPLAPACPSFADTRAECYNGTCRACGFSGGPACQDEPFCAAGNLNNNNICYLCGGLNQPCCKDTEAGNVCAGGQGLACVSGFCAKK